MSVTIAAIQRPRTKLRMIYSVKLVRNGKTKTQTPVRKKEIFVTNRESTQEKSEI